MKNTIEVDVELVRKLKQAGRDIAAVYDPESPILGFVGLVEKIPDPPKPDVVEECWAAYVKHPVAGKTSLRAALRVARQHWGLPPDPELENG